jgi:hypothetical protein
MGIDGIKSKPTTSAAPTSETQAPVATEAAVPAVLSEVATKVAEGFDEVKKKLMSVSGRYAAHKPNVPVREDLKDLISSQRTLVNAGAAPSGGKTAPKIGESHVHGADCGCGPTLKDGTLNTASNKGAGPSARAADSDFLAKAKAEAKKGATPAEIEAAACKLAKEALEKDFGVKVKNGDKNWTAEELSRAHESFKQMPAADQKKLEGLDLIRNAKASAKSQAEMGDKGTVAGEYLPNTDTKDGKRVKNGAIQLYDAAFPSGADARKQSMHVIIHEAGHAVEGRSRDDAVVAANIANDKQNATLPTLNPAAEANKDQWNETNKAGKAFGVVSTADKPGTAFLKAQIGVTNAIDKLQKAKTPAELTKAQADLDAAKAARDKALAGMSGHKKESAANDLVAATDKQEKTARAYADANIPYLAAKADADAKMAELKKVATVTTKADGSYETKSNELSAFQKAKGKEKAVSGYGASAGPESYAEAYALYQRDPAAMKKEFPNQYKFFHDKHRNAAD